MMEFDSYRGLHIEAPSEPRILALLAVLLSMAELLLLEGSKASR